jgi:hypothetical protein
LLVLVALALVPATFACDSTTCLMLTRGAAGLMGRKAFQVDVSFRYTDMSARRQGTSSTSAVIRPKVYIEGQTIFPGYHEDLRGSESFLQVDLAWGLAARTTVFASMPVFGQKYYDVGHQGSLNNYNIRGIGDLVLGARQALLQTPQRALVASVGFKVPTGDNGIIDDYDDTVLDPTMQPGTGSGDFITALQWSTVAAAKMEVALSGSYQMNRTNDYNYRFGNEAIAAVTASRAFGRFTPSLQVKLNGRGRSEFVEDDVPSTGGTVVYLNTGVRMRSADGLGLYGFLLFPVYRDVNDAQLAPKLSVVVGLSKTF